MDKLEKPTPSLDFIVIGAAKSGTTTLFELTKNHPQLSMPHDKEVPFFSDDAIYQKGMDWYLRTYFGNAPNDTFWGTVTPQYMLGKHTVSPATVAERIKKEVPDAKLVAILRHPAKRAFSHYKMVAQRGHFTKTFTQAVDELLASEDKDELRYKDISDSNAFLFGSEYARILEEYYKHFSSEQILVLYTENLKSQPEKILKNFLTFLGVDNEYAPENIGAESRKGGAKPKVKLLTPGYIYKIPFVKKLWKEYAPHAVRKRVEYSINLWNIKPDETMLASNDPIYQKLVAHYASDVRKLEQLTGQKVPWQDWR